MRFANSKATALLRPGACPMTIAFNDSVLVWLTDDRCLCISECPIASRVNITVDEPWRDFVTNAVSGLTVATLDGVPITPPDGDWGYSCPRRTDLDVAIAGRTVVRLRRTTICEGQINDSG